MTGLPTAFLKLQFCSMQHVCAVVLCVFALPQGRGHLRRPAGVVLGGSQ
jgi:hypothetical protein